MGKANKLTVSVRNLVEFSCKTGDLQHMDIAGPTADEGIKAHRKLQSQLKPDQKAEVRVTADVEVLNTLLSISGRVDLYQKKQEELVLGEIKSCYAPVDKIPEATRTVHWAQLKVYGFCVLNEENAPAQSITLQLLWINVVTDELFVEEQCYSLKELTEFTLSAAQRYVEWIHIVQQLGRRTVKSAQALAFPHSKFRVGQRNMASAVYVTTRDKGTLLCEAPTGIGKTISTLFPAAKALGEQLIDSAVYLTAKTSGRQSANDALSLMQDNGLFITAVTITAKKTTCHCSNGTCEWNNDGRCPLTVGFFDRLPDARVELLKRGVIEPADIDAAAHRFQLCPFELTLQLLPWVNLVICDFNYVFDPLVRLSQFTEGARRKLLLVDETHNLIDRARSMYSAQLHRQQMLQASREPTGNHLLGKAFRSVANAIQRVARGSEALEFAENKTPDTLNRAVKKCVDALATSNDNQQPLTESQADAAKEIYRYLVIEELFGDHHKAVSTKTKPDAAHCSVRLQCLNASDKLTHSFQHFRAAVVFSATLRPQHYFRESLGLPENTPCLSLPSPFKAEQQGTFLCHWLDTRYHSRAAAIEPLISLAHTVYHARSGKYQMFFPSYAFMEEVHSAFTKKHPNIPTIIQQRSSTEVQRRTYLNQFQEEQQLLAFSILGGIYGEGIDYVGDKLIGTIIVGTGLASISLQQKLIERDFTSQGVNGFDYASKYPGFTRVLQTAGRVIRSETDAGVVILADRRFNEPFYHNIFPDNWHLNQCGNLAELNKCLHDFWAEHFSLTSSL